MAYQTDIIVYGECLQEYFKLEFGEKSYEEIDFVSVKESAFGVACVNDCQEVE